MKRISKLLLLPFLLILISSCGRETPVPQPRGYFRIDLPEKDYVRFDTTYPYTFEYPSVARVVARNNIDSIDYWINLEYPQLKATLHISYREVDNNIHVLLDDAINLANKHLAKATAMEPTLILRDTSSVYGLLYDIRGSGVASTSQFYLTDSLNHYMRGALYFYLAPNNDSLAPVIDYIHDDIWHLINTLEWK